MAEDRKFKFEDGHFVNRVSGKSIPDDEPVIIFRARDWHALDVLLFYQQLVADTHHVRAVQDRIKEFQAFRDEHPERMKEPGITRDIRLNDAPTEPADYGVGYRAADVQPSRVHYQRNVDFDLRHAISMALRATARLREQATKEREAFDGWNTNPSRFSRLAADLEGEAEGCERLAALAALSNDGWRADMENAPHACHVLASLLDRDAGEWIYAVILSPPCQPFTHWRPLPNPPSERGA